MRKFTIVIILALLAVSSANAAQISDSDSFAFPLSPGSQVITLSQFDDLGGTRTLNYVKITLESNIHASVTGENDSAISGVMSLDFTGLVGADALTLSTSTGINVNSGGVSVAATDGVSDSGPDFHDFGIFGGSDTDDDYEFANFASYIGTGTFAVNMTGSGGFSIGGVTDSTLKIADFAADGEVTVVYDYTVIPEPTTIAILACGAFGFLRKRKTA